MSSQKQKVTREQPKKKEKNARLQGGSLLEITDRVLARYHSWMIWVILGITALVSFLLFDPKVSMSGDDAYYILRASDFIHSFKYPSFQGPLYPMVLGLLVAVVGISLIPMKLLSMICMFLAIFLLYRLLKDRIPGTILAGAMLLMSLNSYLLYYASQTYSEAFYILIEVVMVLVFFRYFVDEGQPAGFKNDLKRHLLLAVILLALTLSRSIGFSALAAVIGYFLFTRQWKNLIFSVLAFAAAYLVFQGIRFALWQESSLQFGTQGSSLMNKDYYNPQDGKEDIPGLIKRFWDNSNLYLSKHFLCITGFRELVIGMATYPFLTIFLYLLAAGGIILTFFRNRYLFFTGLVAGSFLLVTFVVLQAKWDQNRLIIPAIPFMLLLLLSSLYYITSLKKFKVLQFILPLLVVVSFLQTLGDTTVRIRESQKDSGRFGGLTPDWKNYLKASEWAAENLPEDAVIACRKPSISFVYGKGRTFYGVMQLPSYDYKSFFERWKKDPSGYLAYNYKDFTGKNLTQDVYYDLKKNLLVQLVTGDNFYYIGRFSDSSRVKVTSALSGLGVNEISSAADLERLTSGGDKAPLLIYPDSLLNTFRQNKVSHVITANLRRNTMQKNGQIINTVERYMAFIEDKYPGITTKLTQIGGDENEPASVLKINYEVTGAGR